MYNILNFTKESQEFLNFIATSNRATSASISVAAAKALSGCISLPTSNVVDLDAHIRNNVNIPLQSKLSKLNEIALIDVKTIIDLAENFYKARYYAAFPPRTIYVRSKETALMDFFNIGMSVSIEVSETIQNASLEMSKLHNGFVQLFEELDS